MLRNPISHSQNAGQNCIGIERILVHSSQYDKVFKLIAERAQQLRLGCALTRPTDGLIPVVDCGAMISNERFDHLKNLIEAAVAHGAVLETGGQPWPHPYLEHGLFFSPTVIGNVDPNSAIAQEECKSQCLESLYKGNLTSYCAVFAPIVLVMKYETEEEAVQIANGTRYGLGASVFGPDQERCERLAKKLQCGMVALNDFATFYVSPGFSSLLSAVLTTTFSFLDQVSSIVCNEKLLFTRDALLTAKTFRSEAPRCLGTVVSEDLKVCAPCQMPRPSCTTGGHG